MIGDGINSKIRIVALIAAIIIFLSLAYLNYAIIGVMLLALISWSIFPDKFIITSIAIVIILFLIQSSVGIDKLIFSIFSTYGVSSLWIIVSGFIFAGAMDVSGLAKRLAMNVITSLGANPRYIILSVAVANLIVAPLSPSTTAKAVLMLPICIGLIKAMGAKKGSPYAASVMLMAAAANNICSTAFLTATVPNPISSSYMAGAGLSLTWTDWFVMAFPLTTILLVVAWLLLEMLFKTEVKQSRKMLSKIVAMKKRLGSMSKQEKIVAVLFSIALILWITEKYNPYNAGLISLLLSFVLFLPSIGVFKIRRFGKTLPWDSLFVFAAAMYLAKVVEQSNALTPVVKSAIEYANIKLPVSVLIFLNASLAVLLHIFFTSTTVFATIIMPIAIAAANAYDIPVALFALPVAFATPLAIILPVNTIPNIIFYSTGYFSTKQMIKYGIALSIFSIFIIFFVGIPYWQLIGLIKP